MKHGISKDFDESGCVPLALFTDWVNPNKSTAAIKLIWPITLTSDIRYFLGPMMLLGIVPGHGRKEPKSLNPYISILVDELLGYMEWKMYDSHIEALVPVKIALLQYLCTFLLFPNYCIYQVKLHWYRVCFVKMVSEATHSTRLYMFVVDHFYLQIRHYDLIPNHLP